MLKTIYSPYWLILFILLGLTYAYIMYNKKGVPWSPLWNKILFALRAIAVSLIAYLLLEPFISIQKTETEKSKIIFLWDDSESLLKSKTDLKDNFRAVWDLKQRLEAEKEVEVPVVDLNGQIIENPDSLENRRKESPLNKAIKDLSSKVDAKLISEVVFFSDGIYNKGIAPDYYAFPFKLSTVGIGDTSEKKDIILRQLRYNKVAYEGNKFPIEVDVLQKGFQGKRTNVILSKNGETISQKLLEFGSEPLKSVQFLVEANSTGYQDFKVNVEGLEGEFNTENNYKNAYVNIIEGKKRILMLSPYPHPDIKALAASIDQNDNYELEVFIDVINNKKVEDIANYDLAILFHLPNNRNSFNQEVELLKKAGTPLWFITGSNINYTLHNELNKSVDLTRSYELDKAFAYLNPNFDLFELNAEESEIQRELPPAFMPFVTHNFHPLVKTLMMKKVGNVKTQQPVFVFYADDEVRQATLLVQNFRVWRMVEYLNTQDHAFFDDWVTKTIRYLTADNDKDRFKIFPIKEAFADNEIVKFQVELYNEVFDRVYNSDVVLNIQNENDSLFNYEFSPDRLKPDFELGTLPGGVYEYTASTEIQGQRFNSAGQFVVEEFEIENQNLQANYELLRRVADKNEGNFFTMTNLDELEKYLMSKEYPKVLSGSSETVAVTQNILPYLIIFLLVFSEWFVRRFYGSY